MENDVLLIAGLGPGHMEEDDLQDSFLYNIKDNIDKRYVFEGIYYDPGKLQYENKNKIKTNVLRPKENNKPQLIVDTLKMLLENNNILYNYLNIYQDEERCRTFYSRSPKKFRFIHEMLLCKG